MTTFHKNNNTSHYTQTTPKSSMIRAIPPLDGLWPELVVVCCGIGTFLPNHYRIEFMFIYLPIISFLSFSHEKYFLNKIKKNRFRKIFFSAILAKNVSSTEYNCQINRSKFLNFISICRVRSY